LLRRIRHQTPYVAIFNSRTETLAKHYHLPSRPLLPEESLHPIRSNWEFKQLPIRLKAMGMKVVTIVSDGIASTL
jgi:hypothetical protein